MKKKTIATSLTSLALCGCLMTGATYALFTSESKANIAIQAGTVKMTATIDQASLLLNSPTLIGVDGTVVDATNAASETAFANGGTASFDEKGYLTLENMTPGDSAEFSIDIVNESNVTIKYKTVFEAVGENNDLLDGLQIYVNEKAFTETQESEWVTLMPNVDVASMEIKVLLPTTAGNEYQGDSAKLSFAVYAVQGNTKTPTPIRDDEGLKEAIASGQDYNLTGGSYSELVIAKGVKVNISGDTQLTGASYLVSDAGGDMTVDNIVVSNTRYAALCYLVESKITLNGGTYTGASIVGASMSNNSSEAVINGGTFNVSAICSPMYPPTTVYINGGTFNGLQWFIMTPKGQTLIITGGTFSIDPTTYLAEGYVATKNDDGMWVVGKA